MCRRTSLLATLLVLAGVVCANRSVGKAERLDNHAEGSEYKAFAAGSAGGASNATCALAVYLHVPKTGGATQADEIFRNAWTSFATRLYRFGPVAKKRIELPSHASDGPFRNASGSSMLPPGAGRGHPRHPGNHPRQRPAHNGPPLGGDELRARRKLPGNSRSQERTKGRGGGPGRPITTASGGDRHEWSQNTPHDWIEFQSFLMDLRREDVAPGDVPKPIHRYAVEFHFCYGLRRGAAELARLRTHLTSIGCKMVVFTRIREPFAAAMSYQAMKRHALFPDFDGDICQDPSWIDDRCGPALDMQAKHLFFEGVDNPAERFSMKEAEQLLGEGCATSASCGIRALNMRPPMNDTSMRALDQLIEEHVDVMGTTERYDETSLLVGEALGLSFTELCLQLSQTHKDVTTRPKKTCPESTPSGRYMAPKLVYDKRMYERWAPAFGALVRGTGADVRLLELRRQCGFVSS